MVPLRSKKPQTLQKHKENQQYKTVVRQEPKAVVPCKTQRTKEKKLKDQSKLLEMKSQHASKKSNKKPLTHLTVTMIQDGPEVPITQTY